MKPVIKKQTHYNLLLMKDDSPARTFRVHSTALKVLLVLFILLLLTGGASIAGGVHFFKEYLRLVAQTETQDKELSEMRLQLERLVNLESLIVASNGSVPLAKNEEVGASAPPNRQAPDGERPAEGQDAEIPAGNDAGTGTPPDAASGDAGHEATPRPDSGAEGPVNGPTDGQPGESGNQQEAAASLTSDGPPLLSLDAADAPLRINSFNARVTGRERLRISYELATTPTDEPRTVSGSVRYRAVMADGASLDLTSYDIEGSRFAIARMKPMQSSARMPQGHLAENVNKIEVIVELADGSVYHDIFSLDE